MSLFVWGGLLKEFVSIGIIFFKSYSGDPISQKLSSTLIVGCMDFILDSYFFLFYLVIFDFFCSFFRIYFLVS